MPQRHPELRNCVEQCLDCHRVCLHTINYCLSQGGDHAAAEHIRLLTDCAEICQTSANFMLRGSALHERTCAICAEICEDCAQDCERFPEDQEMQACAEICRQCSDACREMAGTEQVAVAA